MAKKKKNRFGWGQSEVS